MTHSPLTLDAAGIDALDRRSRSVCVIYPAHPLPTGSAPASARIGVESGEREARLFVDRGIRYDGTDPRVGRWLAQGVLTFPSVRAMLAWLREVTEPPRTVPPEPAASRDPRPAHRPQQGLPGALTDLESASAKVPRRSSAEVAEIRTRLGEAVYGQAHALDTLANLAARHAAKPHPRRPATAMLVGPTGVGKTEAARQLAGALTALDTSGWAFLRLDMAEYAERHAVSRLIGAPPGYVGYGDPSLASRLADNPRHVVLFDEIDRAHPQVLQSLMNLMDAGRLDSANHGSVEAARAILLFTSNLGASDIGRVDEDRDRAGRRHLIRHGMAPELVGRLGVVEVFTELSDADLVAAATRAIGTVAADYDVVIDHIDPAYVAAVVGRVRDSGLGIRAVEHLVETELGTPLAGRQGARAVIGEDGEVMATDQLADAPPSDSTDTSCDPDLSSTGRR